MTTDLIEIDGFIVLIDTTDALEAEITRCQLEDDVIGITFYGSGSVEMEVTYGSSTQLLSSKKGKAFSFFGAQGVQFAHRIFQAEPLRNISIFSTIENIQKLPVHEKELYASQLAGLLSSSQDFAVGPQILMTPEMQTAITKIFETQFRDTTRLLFLKSQVIELLSHYFAQATSPQSETEIIADDERKKVIQAEEIMVQNLDQPPTLNELSKLIGMNSGKLQKNFKQIFGVPVFKYLQNQRLQKAHQLLSQKEMSVQEVAWFVGYESLSSFSNVFFKKYGFRPSELSK
ncbi:helix-turn-helix transcriptional regulator [bacterium SCSIO 12741]|nr:helix-turn-helix transcriptional regulator [bacterium SCSIO 12741]